MFCLSDEKSNTPMDAHKYSVHPKEPGYDKYKYSHMFICSGPRRSNINESRDFLTWCSSCILTGQVGTQQPQMSLKFTVITLHNSKGILLTWSEGVHSSAYSAVSGSLASMEKIERMGE